jgi:hypothetical protein
MNWEQRLRDLVLAGGAVAAVACVDGVGAGASPDPGSDGAGDSGADSNVDLMSVCCNASSDPCCPSLYCGAPVPAGCTEKMAEKMACEADGGAWDDFTGCSGLDSGPVDASSDAVTSPDARDSGPADASSDAVTSPDVDVLCCNANADPCCPSLHCGATVTVQCTEKMACEADGGTWDYGVPGCVHDAGQAD